MALPDHAPKLTYRDYARAPKNGKRYEIIDGHPYVTAAPFLTHQRLAFQLTLCVGGFVETNRFGLFFFAPAAVLLSAHNIVQPDLFFISSERASIARGEKVRGAPDLVIEIVSPSTRLLDERIKRQAYDRAGVGEYWMFYPSRKGVQPYERTDDRLLPQPFLSAAGRGVLTSSLLPGFELPLAELFAE